MRRRRVSVIREDGARPSGRPWAAYAALGLILVAGAAVRLHNIDHGLPFAYHPDEALHFATRALEMRLGGDLDPGYLENPSAYTYLLLVALALAGVAEPPSALLLGRILATALSLVAVAGVFVAARRLWDATAGVAAAGVLAFAFLPVAYSRYALTDTGVLLPVVVATYAAIRAHEDTRLRWYAVGGAAVGLAVGFKYTAGLVGVPLLAVALARSARGLAAPACAGVAAVSAAGAFALTTPYFVLRMGEATAQLASQSVAASRPKVGQGAVEPVTHYLGTLTWGLGWGAAVAALIGVVVQWRRDRARALLLVLFPLLLFAYLCTAGRYFARWLLPLYPVLALLAGLGLAAVAGRVARRPAWRAVVLAALLAAAVAPPVLADVRTARLLGRADTRTVAREHLLRTLPRDARVVIEPGLPRGYVGDRLVRGFRPPAPGALEGGSAQRFLLALEPRSIDRYRRAGFCVVMTMETIAARARTSRIGPALAYYERLARASVLVFQASPFKPGADPPPFDIDRSTHLYDDGAYARPGPRVEIRRLRRCRQGAGGPSFRAPVAPLTDR